jgi:hypothetical protein
MSVLALGVNNSEGDVFNARARRSRIEVDIFVDSPLSIREM